MLASFATRFFLNRKRPQALLSPRKSTWVSQSKQFQPWWMPFSHLCHHIHPSSTVARLSMTDGSFIQSSSKVYVRASIPQMFSTGFSPDVFGKSIQPICSSKCPKAHIVFFWVSLGGSFSQTFAGTASTTTFRCTFQMFLTFNIKCNMQSTGVDGSTQEDQLVLFIHSSPPDAGRHPKRCFAAAVSFHVPSVSACSLRFCRTRFTLLFTGFYCRCCIAPTFNSLNSSSSPTRLSLTRRSRPFLLITAVHPSTSTTPQHSHLRSFNSSKST